MDIRKCTKCETILPEHGTLCSICGTIQDTGVDGRERPVIDYGQKTTLFQQSTDDMQKWRAPLLVIGVAVIELVFFVVVAVVAGDGSSVVAHSSPSNNANTARTSISAPYSSGNRSNYSPSANTSVNYDSGNNTSSSVVGSEGYLTENLNIRSAPNRTAEILGTHYKDAQIQVLDQESYSTTDGYAIWYKVKVLKYGCDSQNTSSCGKNWERDGSFGWMEGSNEGWMNAKYINLSR